ncbi:EamA family transporter [Marinifilum sp. N1E240]|uniref:DMT family transporter n=1 Tax=Marinifilum sp. N1E240 TaxID=2608082 RepID=UPI00128E4EED|nr:DMT family transporter [Marinifilum sp. N1E240]MPQ47652.1 EamA family transporter [Marinifilum sp. N1E240]
MKREGSSYGIFLMILSVLAFGIMASLVRSMSHVSTYITVFVRFAIGVGIVGILAMLRKIDLKFVRSPLLLLRGITGTASVALFYLAIVKIGMGKASVYSYSYPLFASLLSVIILKEKIQTTKWLMILLAFIGIAMVSFQFTESGKSWNFGWFDFLAMLSAITNAISIIIVKKLHGTDNSYAIFFAQSIVGFWLFLIPANLPELTGPVTSSYVLIFIGLASACAQLLNTEGYRHVSVATGSPFHMLIPIVNVIVGVFVFNEVFSLQEIIGSSLVVIACLGILKQNSSSALK